MKIKLKLQTKIVERVKEISLHLPQQSLTISAPFSSISPYQIVSQVVVCSVRTAVESPLHNQLWWLRLLMFLPRVVPGGAGSGILPCCAHHASQDCAPNSDQNSYVSPEKRFVQQKI